jgi:membrane-associated phospholipid phosphatase
MGPATAQPLRGRREAMNTAQQRTSTYSGRIEQSGERSWSELALQDWIVLVYLGALLAFTLAGAGPRRSTALSYLTADLALFALALVVSRAGVLRGLPGAIVYRVGLFGAVFGSFSQLQYVLPTARSLTVDAQLYAFDKAVFGIEPAEALDRFVSTGTTEWFSFFYFSYFFILALHDFPFMLAARNVRLLSEFTLGIITLFCVAHLLYIVVPGHGPNHHLASSFVHELDGPLWWRLVKATVDAVEMSARTDIFPSLHTAAPTYLALFAIRHRRVAPFRYAWLPLVIFASQIVISTMFLRWHYLVDVIVGFLLALLTSRLAGRVAAWEGARREALCKRPVWTLLR